MTSDSGSAHPADSPWGPPDAHVSVKYLTPKSKVPLSLQLRLLCIL